MLRRSWLVTIVILVLLLLTAPAAFASGYVYEDSFGRYGYGLGEFANAQTLAIGPAGAVYVPDSGSSRVQKFSSEGVFLSAVDLGAFGTAALVDSTGSLLVADYYSPVYTFTTGLTALGSWGSGLFSGVNQMTMDASGNLYVTEYGSNRVQVFDPGYNYFTEWPSSGASGIAVDDDEVYVADWNNYLINVYDHAGTLLRSFGSYAELGTPSNMAFAPDGSLLVGDASGKVTRWDPDAGSLIDVVATYGGGPGQVWSVWGLAVAPNGDLYVPDQYEYTVQRYAWDGTPPVVTHDYDGEWHSTPVTVQFDMTDEVSGDVWLYVSTDDGATWDLADHVDVAAPADHSNDGIHYIRYQAVDGVGNWTPERTVKVKIDTRKPRTAVSDVPAAWTRSDVAALLTATDVGSGVGGVHWRLDGTVWWTDLAEDRIVPIGEGVHLLEYYAWDNADPLNVEAVKSVEVKVDKTKPVAVASNAISVVRGGTATFKYTLADNLSPTCTAKLVIKKKTTVVKTVLLGAKVTTPLATAYSKKLTISLPVGVYYWSIQATDLAGNKVTSLAKKLTVK